MKRKQLIDFIIDTILIVIGAILLILPIYQVSNIKYIFFIVMVTYAILNLIQFLLTRKSKDYEGLYTFIISIVIGLTGLSFKFNDPIQLSISLISWVFLMAIAKLIKANYYNDLRDRMWKLRIFTLVIFIVTGLLTSINIYHSEDVQLIVLGFFFLIHGILELIDPMCKSLLQKN